MKDYFEQIDSYLIGQLSLEDQVDFEREMGQSESLRKAVENYPYAQKFAQQFIELETRHQLKVIKRKSILKRIFLGSIAAGILLLFTFWILKKYLAEGNLKSTPDQIFASLYEPPATTFVRNDIELSSPVDSAIYFFEQQKFQASLDILLPLYLKDSSDLLTLRYLSHNYLASRLWEQARQSLTKIFLLRKDPYSTEALYHLVMLDLIEQRKVDARSKFQRLKNNPLISATKRELLEKMLSE